MDKDSFPIDKMTGIATADPVVSVAGFVRLVDKLTMYRPPKYKAPPHSILFRGQYKIHHNLVPRIGRPDFNYSAKTEAFLFEEFKRRSTPFINGTSQPQSELEWLALAQHHGMATRLLDWTENALTALFFSVQESITDKERGGGENAAVWAFLPEDDVDHLNADDLENFKEPFSNRVRTKLFRPRHFTDRIRAQTGWFTVHKYLKSKKFLALNENDSYKSQLVCIPIDHNKFKTILGGLRQCGVTAVTIYPDLTGLSSFLNYLGSPWVR